MAVSRSEIARRLKAARENCGLTQRQVAEAIGVPRTAVVQMEAGNRAVSSLELSRLARLYRRGLDEFFCEGEFEEDPLVALFRTGPGLAEDPVLQDALRHCVHLCRELTHLERLLDLDTCRPLPVIYALELPSDRWEAICQGRFLADQERHRLDLGTSPIWEIAETVRRQGVRVTECEMPDDISGMFFHGRDIGLAIAINRRHPRKRRLFSYSHEYCHVLADRGRPGTISHAANRQELAEVRANTFAAHFLMPEKGVRAFLQSLGKGEATRQEQAVFDGVEEIPAQKRMAPGSQELQVHDVVLLAHHFGVSYEAALYHLLNLKLIAKERLDLLRQQGEAASALASTLRFAAWDEAVHWTLTEQILALGFEAYRRGEISRNKLLELAGEAGLPRESVEAALPCSGPGREPVDAVFPA